MTVQEIEEELKHDALDLEAVDQKVYIEDEEVIEKTDHAAVLVSYGQKHQN